MISVGWCKKRAAFAALICKNLAGPALSLPETGDAHLRWTSAEFEKRIALGIGYNLAPDFSGKNGRRVHIDVGAVLCDSQH